MLLAHRTALLRVLALALALSVLPLSAGATEASTSKWLSNCAVNVRARPSTGSTVRKVLAVDTTVTVVGKVSGGYWTADCGKWVSGSSWYKITAIGSRTVSSLLGVSAVYAASGLFRGAADDAYGVDVSSWQGWIDFEKVRASGRRFVIAKASEGNTWTDRYYDRNRYYAMAAGLRFTGYHFARPGSAAGDAVSEADHFIAVLGLRRGMLVPALDLEVSGGLGTAALQAWTRAFLGRLHDRLGVRAMIYTNPSFWRTAMGDTTWFSANGYRVLWIANWGVTSPSVPAANWSSRSWTFWQYSSCGSVPGISGCVDLNRFRGTDFSAVTY